MLLYSIVIYTSRHPTGIMVRTPSAFKTELMQKIDAFLPYTDKTSMVNKERIRSVLEKIVSVSSPQDVQGNIDVKQLYAEGAQTDRYDDVFARAYKSMSSIENNCGTMAKIAKSPALETLYGPETAHALHIGYIQLKARLKSRLKAAAKATPATPPPPPPPQEEKENATTTVHILPPEGMRALDLLKVWSENETIGDHRMVAQIIDTFIYASMYTAEIGPVRKN